LPAEHKDVYVSTTLGIVIFTTLVCGGLTEPMLNRTGMRTAANKDDADSSTRGDSTHDSSSMHSTTHGPLHGHGSQDTIRDSSGGPPSPVRGGADEETAVARTATSTSFIEMLRGVTNRAQYDHLPGVEMTGMRTAGLTAAGSSPSSSARSFIEFIDAEYMRPTFGGP
jgi:hypothetical protein